MRITTTRDKGFMWMGGLITGGLFGILFSWLPFFMAVSDAVRGVPFKDALKWEWEAWLQAIESSVRAND